MRESGPAIGDLTGVSILDADCCPRYAAGIIQDIKLGPSPFWLRYRLYLSGIRSINNIVDVTNYVMLEMGQPLHAFDYDRLKENRIVVRRADEGEEFSTLDGLTHTLSRETLMICDGERAVAIAGIMGGLNSEISETTNHVLLESAFFDPVTIRRGSKRLGLSTEASYRFERGSDIGGVTTALKRALGLISGLAGGRVATGLIDEYPKTHTPLEIRLGVDKTNQVLGTMISREKMIGYLKSLDMEVRDGDDNSLCVTPPSFRVDIARDVDLMEEVARMSGYDNIPVTYPSLRPSEEGESPELSIRDQVKSIMIGSGFTEIVTYSFVSPDSADIIGAEEKSPLRSFVRLMNPLTIDQSVMRTSLVPGLMATVKANLLRDERDLKLFEWGKVFIRKEQDQQPSERTFLAGVMIGPYQKKSWYDNERPVDFYDIKGAAEALLRGLGLHGFFFKKGAAFPGYDPDISACIYHSDLLMGQAGRVSAGVMKACDLEKEDAFMFEVDVEVLLERISGSSRFRPFVKFPAVYRDISLLVDRQVQSASIVGIIEQEGGELVESVHIFDLYEGDKIAPSEKALAFRVCYRSAQGTLDGSKVNSLHDAIIGRIRRETGGRLREG